MHGVRCAQIGTPLAAEISTVDRRDAVGAVHLVEPLHGAGGTKADSSGGRGEGGEAAADEPVRVSEDPPLDLRTQSMS